MSSYCQWIQTNIIKFALAAVVCNIPVNRAVLTLSPLAQLSLSPIITTADSIA